MEKKIAAMGLANMRIGFAKADITPPVGTELGGYAGYRPCSGVHDPLYCKAVVLEQAGTRYALIALDLMCVDEALYRRIGAELEGLGIEADRLIVCAIHSHASPAGLVPGEGPLASVNATIEPGDPGFADYIRSVIRTAADACRQAADTMEPFQIRVAQGAVPEVGSERHTGAKPAGNMTVIQCRTVSGKVLTLYNFPCHPTVLGPSNLETSADFAADIEKLLGGDMAVFLNGAAGDISTRYTRREATFRECHRMARIAAEQIRNLLEGTSYENPHPLRSIHGTVTLQPRQVEAPEIVEEQLKAHTARWEKAVAEGADPMTVRILKSYVEGAGVNLEFARTMGGIRRLQLPVTVFRFGGVSFATIPGELFSALKPQQIEIISYANGYFRYLSGVEAYDAGYYEAMAAIVARGEGEKLMEEVLKLSAQLDQ